MDHSSAARPGKAQAQDHGRPHTSSDAEALTAREDEILSLLERDKTGREIAEALGISLSTVRTHIRSIRQKLHAGHRDWARRGQAE